MAEGVHRVDEVARHARDLAGVGDLARDLLERGVRIAEDLADHGSHHVGFERPDGDLDALLGADLREHRGERLGSSSSGSATSSTIAYRPSPTSRVSRSVTLTARAASRAETAWTIPGWSTP